MLKSLAWTWGLLLCAAMTTAHAGDSTASDRAAGAIKPSAVKWHPGHYAAVDRKQNSNPRYLKGLYDDLDATPALRGVLLRFTWSELEPSKGQYDFSAIEKHLNELAAHRKQLVLMVETKSFGYPSDSPIAPEYVLNDAAFENGAFKYPAGAGGVKTREDTARRGSNLKLWNAQVYARLSALMTALGKRFNGHPNFEAVALQETAMGSSEQGITPQQEDAFFDNLLKLQAQMRADFPNTVTIQFTNYPIRKLELLTSRYKAMGTSLGGPDVFLSDPGLNRRDGVYGYYPKLAGVVPLAPMVAASNYAAPRHNGPPGEEPSVEQIFDFARDRLKANYIFWARPPTKAPQFPRLVQILNQSELRGDPAGGLSKACPSAFASCVN